MSGEGSGFFLRTMEERGFAHEVRELVLSEWGIVRLEPGCRDIQAYITPNRKSSRGYSIQDTRSERMRHYG